jgi:hypothetical protein
MEVNMEDKIISVLNKVRTDLSNELETKTKELVQPFDDFANKLSAVEVTPLKISGLSIEEIDNTFTNISIEIIEKLEMYKNLSKLSFFPLTDEQKLDISNIMRELINQMSVIKKYIIDCNPTLKDINNKLEKIDEVIKKITALYNNKGYLNSNDITDIVNIFKESILPIEEQIAVVQEISLLSLTKINSNEKEEQEEDILVIEETGIDREKIVDLFKEYGYDFDDFKEHDKNELLNYGRIENIREILDVLASNNLSIYIKGTSRKLTQIFINSSGSIMTTIIENIKFDIEKNKSQFNIGISDGLSLEKVFGEYLDTPSIFINGKRQYKRKETSSRGPGGENHGNASIIGAFDNYVRNRKLLLEKGIDINLVITKCKTLLGTPSQKVKENFDCFEFYGIPESVYTRTLYSLTATDPLSAIDQFIELGCYRYILSNFSYVNRRPDDLIFYRIVKASQLGDPIYSERRTQNIEFLGKISNDSKNSYGINRDNKQDIVSQYIPGFNPIYDEIVNKDRNAGPIILAINNYFVKSIEEYKVDDLRYDFNGVIISRFKVLRIYETLIKNRMAGTYSSILYAICKNSILTEEQYRNIVNCLDRSFGNLRGVARG